MTPKPESVYSIVKNLIEANGFVTNSMIAEYGVSTTYTARNRIREFEKLELNLRGKRLIYTKGESWKDNRWTVVEVKSAQMALAI